MNGSVFAGRSIAGLTQAKRWCSMRLQSGPVGMQAGSSITAPKDFMLARTAVVLLSALPEGNG